MSILIQLFLEFFKIGLFAVGGGLATIPFLHQLAEKYTWFTVETLVDMIAISESTPGAMGVNMATYSGFTTAGISGSLIATLGLVLPSIVIIIIIAHFLKQFSDSPVVSIKKHSPFCGLVNIDDQNQKTSDFLDRLIGSRRRSVSVLTVNSLLNRGDFLCLRNVCAASIKYIGMEAEIMADNIQLLRSRKGTAN